MSTQSMWTAQKRRLNRLQEAIPGATHKSTLESIIAQVGEIEETWTRYNAWPDWWSLADRVRHDAQIRLNYDLRRLI